MILYRADNVHLYGWTPRGRRHPKWRQANPSFGLHLRVRVRGAWRHVRLAAVARFGAHARGTYTLELSSWRTRGGSLYHNRLGLKTFARLKVGLGGARP